MLKNMELIDSKEGIKNSKLLWLAAGVFLIPTLNSIDSLVGGTLKILGVQILPRIIFSVSLNGFITLCLLGVIMWIVKNWTVDNAHSLKLLTLKDFKKYGIICFFIIVAGRATSFFVLNNIAKELDFLSDTKKVDFLHDSVNWRFTSAVLTEVRELLILGTYFVVVIKNK